MKQQGKETWRTTARKLKQAKRKYERLRNNSVSMPATESKQPILTEIRDLKVTISVLELKEERLRPKKV